MVSTWTTPLALALVQAGAFISTVPLPGLRTQPAKIKAMVSACLAIVLLPATVQDLSASGGDNHFALAAGYVGRAIVAAAFVTAINELYAAVTSVWSVQTGLSYSSVLDPTKESESTALTSIIQLLFLLHFVGLDLHLQILGASLGTDWFHSGTEAIDIVGMLAVAGKKLLSSGLAWGLPYMALLMGVDLVLALGARLYERFQSGALSNPLKQLLLLVLLLCSLPLWRGETGTWIAFWVER